METYVVGGLGNRMTDLYNTKGRYEREVKKIDDWNVQESDRRLFIKFLHSMQARGIGYVQLLKYIEGMKALLKSYDKPFRELKKEDLELFLISMNYLKPKSRHIRWYSIKKFFDFIGLGKKFFPVRFMKTRHKTPPEILTEREVDMMVEMATNLKTKSFIGVLYESGCRIGELMMLKKENVTFDEDGAILIVDGKTGRRRVRIIRYANYLKAFLDSRPIHDRIFNFSWHIANTTLKESAMRVGITKKIYPHLFRHSRATHLSQALTDQQLKQFFGWTRGSEMANIYVHLSGRDIDSAILNYYKDKDTEFDKLKGMGIG